MIACLYGRDFAPFVEPAVRDICAAAAARRGDIRPLTIESAIADPQRRADIARLYVLPFDAPTETPTALVRELFPRAEVITNFAAQELCWDKIATQERLVDRGLPVPDTLITADPAELLEFVRRHNYAILKERFACAGQGHIVVWLENGGLVGDSGSRRYTIELVADGERHIDGDHLRYPAPFYTQRVIVDVRQRGITPGQLLRAYVVDGNVVFWTERYRDRYLRPSDWIVNVHLGAKYRFELNVSEEAKKLALRAVQALGLRIGAVDMIRTGSAGTCILEVDTDSHHMLIDRQFKLIPDYRDFFNLDRYIAEALLRESVPMPVGMIGAPKVI